MIKAMILSAGYGKRLNPLTLKYPKPLLKIGNQTLLFNTIKFLEKYGVKEIVINVHFLGYQIIDYLDKKKFDLKIKIIEEKDKILDTGGGVLNAINYFSNNPFLIINPDTLWNKNYHDELKLVEKKMNEEKNCECAMLVVNKNKSFDINLKGDFNLIDDLINRNDKKNYQYIYTGLQVINPKVFANCKNKIFSINEIWNKLIEENKLFGIKSKNTFYHVSTLKIYENLKNKF
tara:strand:+ start:3396 stop:4091 length:696 start_codon:yes stop_codon:yes gene_type:complete